MFSVESSVNANYKLTVALQGRNEDKIQTLKKIVGKLYLVLLFYGKEIPIVFIAVM